jgi:hypothetical protein
LITSLNATIPATRAVGYPDQIRNQSYYLFTNFLPYNQIGQSYADTITNASTYLIQAFRNLTNAANNTRDDWSSVISNISMAISMVGSSGSMQMSWASMQFQNVNMLMNTLFNNLNTVFQPYTIFLPMVNVNQTPANIMRMIPSPTIMAAVLNQITNATNQYIGLVNSTSQQINNTYNLFRQADSYVLSIERQLNSTIANVSSTTNATKAFFNQSTLNIIRYANSVYNTFMNALPATLKASSQWQSDWGSANMTRDMYNVSVANIAIDINNYVDMYAQQVQQSLTMYYQNNIAQMISMIRMNLFSNFMTNASATTCFSRIFNQSTALFNSTGGAAALFSCYGVENNTLAEIQTIVTGYLNSLSADVNATQAYLRRCQNLTNIPVIPDPNSQSTYSLQTCLETVSVIYKVV